MVCQKPIVIDPNSIALLGAGRARKVGRPKLGQAAPRRAITKPKSYALSEAAVAAVTRAAEQLGVSESSVVEALALALSSSFGDA